MVIDRIGRYRILKQLGEGGMGVVYAAHDPRLDRPVAVKTIRGDHVDPTARKRFWREARAAAKVSHPNICQLYEIDEEGDVLYLVMELLDGQTLGKRIAQGPIPPDEAVQIILAVLGALESLHAQGVIHRDLKPNNVFLAPVGVKLLDFGLARPMTVSGAGDDLNITQVGTVTGTPHYMAPELWLGEEAGPAADVFAAGALLYEMITGQHAFRGNSPFEVYEKVLTAEPPPLAGTAAAARIDQVIHRALRKKPSERFQTAAAMAAALKASSTDEESGERIAPRRLVRLMGLPFRELRPDPETSFLAFSLPDAVTSSLSSLGSLTVRSSTTAAGYAGDVPDLQRIASEADVDVIVVGSLLRAGDQLRVTAQLLEVPAGTVLWSQTFQTPIQDLFELQDALTRGIVESLAVPLSGRERESLRRDTPTSAQAYEFYLRANQVAYDAQQWELARDLYEKCLELDPTYAPAWARLGRVHRAISIYTRTGYEENTARAEQAFQRALALNPDLSIAHNLSTYVEVELGRGQEAMLRLLDRARIRMQDPELFAGLVQACRYCGLLDESIAAYERARRIDPAIRTSVAHALLSRGDFKRAITVDHDDPPWVTFLALELSGRSDEAVAALRARETSSLPPLLHDLITATRALLEGKQDESVAVSERLFAAWRSRDPCGRYYAARHFARLGNTERALLMLRQTVESGFYVPSFFEWDPWLDSLRADPEFGRILTLAASRHAEARRAFDAADGRRILGLSV
jgi:serine/threonine-protein kinase